MMVNLTAEIIVITSSMNDQTLIEKIESLVAHRKSVVEKAGDRVTTDWALKSYFGNLTATLDCYLVIASLRGIDVKKWLH